MTNFIQNNIAERLGGKYFEHGNNMYKFEKIKRAKKEAIEKNRHRIN